MSISPDAARFDWRLLLTAILFLIAANLTYRLVDLLHSNQIYKTDLAEINHIRYGLLNAGEWVQKTTAILDKKIDEYELNDQNKAELRASVEHLIDKALIKVDQIIREKNLGDNETWFDRLTGYVKQFVTDVLVDIQGLRSHVPEFTDMMFNELNRSGGKDKIKQFLHEKLSSFAENTFTPVDLSRYQAVLTKYDCADVTSCKAKLSENLSRSNTQIAQYASEVFILFALIFSIVMKGNQQPERGQLLVLALSCLVLLLGGILTPMIEIEARISELSFQLLGEPMIFKNQVLYFQSKSITNVVSILTATGKADVVLVGMLVALFSIAFPVAKITASLIYYQNVRGLRYNRVVQFFALKSGKWSMADVLVVALFMAYIGFSGIISSQLSHLQQASRYVDVLTTDGTSLQAGFFLFLGFCIASLLLSGVLEKSVRLNEGKYLQQ